MALRLHVDAAEAVHTKCVLDAVDVLGRREQADHVRAPRIRVLRWRQLSTRRFYVPLDELYERVRVREGRETPSCVIELAACPVIVAGLSLVARGCEMVKPRTSSSWSPAMPKTWASAPVAAKYSCRSRKPSASQRAARNRFSRGGHSSSTVGAY